MPAGENNEINFLTLANYVPAHLAYVNIDTLKYEYVNELFEKSFGIPKEKIIGSHIKYIIGETNYKFALKYIKEVKLRKSCSYENSFNLTSGKRWIQVNYSPVFDTNNEKVVGIAVVSNDITERKNAELALMESEERFQMLFNKAPLSYQSLDIDGKFIEVNQQWLDTLGYTRDEVIGKWFGDFLSPEYRDGFLERFPIFKEKGEIHSEFEMVHKNGIKLFIAFEGRIGHDLKGEFKQTHCILQDITKSKQVEEEQRKWNMQFTKLSFNAPGLIFQFSRRLDGTYYVPIASEGIKEIFGCSPEDVLEDYSPIAKVIYPDDFDRVVADIENSAKHLTLFTCDFRVQIEGKSIQWIHSKSIPEKLADGTITWYGFNSDITQQKKIEQELLKAKEKAIEANKLKTEFLHNMSHEIRTPLNGIMGFSEILNDPKISEEKRNNYSKIIRNSGQQLLRVIDDILEISILETRQTKLDETEFCLNELLMELYAIFSLKSGERNVPIYLEKPLHDKETHIFSDKSKLNKILSNLIENAIKFTNKGSIEIGYSIENDLIKLYVRDTGIGISAENQKKIFERFSQEDKDIAGTYGGLGLGLSICKENAELLGGDITLESQKGSGSTFYVTIPYKPAGDGSSDINKNSTKNPKADAAKTILVAEDEEVNYLYIEALFEGEIELNCNLIHAKNGKEALDICLENSIDLVLMDIKMPVMNGNEATQKIKLAFPDLPVIAQTAYSTESEKADAMKHGYDDFMSKPLNREKLFETINKFVSIK